MNTNNFLYGSIICLLIYFLLFVGCEEIPPNINMTGVTDTTTNTLGKVVLIEEFTGVRCANCPAGHDKVKDILATKPGKVIAISIHEGFYSVPYDFSKDTFKINEGESITSMVGGVIGYPAGAINRVLFSGESKIAVFKDKWEAFIDQELLKTPPLKIDIANTYTSTTRNLKVDITATYNESINDSNYLSVAITETGIIDAQLTPAGMDTFYIHRHVLRDMFTTYSGEIISGSKVSGFEFKKSYSMTLPNKWIADSCDVVAFVHYNGDSLNVLQAAEKKVIE